ncbi:MAG: hypothetical protein RBU37_26970 [Myxococcota bacterium]|nr:hypothetical protein [Myxococcota bacterium]
MAYDPEVHHRRSIRLQGYDYHRAGVYFVTICSHNRACLFGEVDGEMRLNDAGRMVERWFLELNRKFERVETDTYIVMPDHLHGIVVLGNSPLGATDLPFCLGSDDDQRSVLGVALPTMVQWLKTMTTNEYIRGIKQERWPSFLGRLWQRGYFEHVVRDEDDLAQIRQYIVDNPTNWGLDRESKRM